MANSGRLEIAYGVNLRWSIQRAWGSGQSILGARARLRVAKQPETGVGVGGGGVLLKRPRRAGVGGKGWWALGAGGGACVVGRRWHTRFVPKVETAGCTQRLEAAGMTRRHVRELVRYC
eukprot:scaffold21401_cov116-Isochrysis_galbana.AAC.10